MPDEGELWLIDGFNVVQVALLSGRERGAWWTAPYRAELMARIQGFGMAGAEVWVAFDGDRPVEDAPGAVHSVFVSCADDWLVARVREAPDPARVRVVTADRRLAARVRHHGAQVVSPGELLRRCRAQDARADASPSR